MALLLPFIDDEILADPWAVQVRPRKRRNSWDDLFDLVDWTPLQKRRLDLEPTVQLTKDNFNVKLDVRGYKPEELNVQIEDSSLILSGRHEEKSADGCKWTSREFKRVIALPEQVDLEKIKSCLAVDGRILKIEAPVKAIEAPREQPKEIPIQVTKVTSNKQQLRTECIRSG